MRKTKKAVKQYVDKNPIEQLLGIGGGAAGAAADLGNSVINIDNWDEYLGLVDKQEKQKMHAGDLAEGQELNLKDLKRENSKVSEEKPHKEAGIDYVGETVHAEKRVQQKENQELKNQLQEIAIEIKKLADSSKELQLQFKEVAIEQHVVSPGKYHKSFFTWMLSMIRIARRKVEDSGAWLAAMHSKKKSRE